MACGCLWDLLVSSCCHHIHGDCLEQGLHMGHLSRQPDGGSIQVLGPRPGPTAARSSHCPGSCSFCQLALLGRPVPQGIQDAEQGLQVQRRLLMVLLEGPRSVL
jgi:hypothetical protein